MIKVVVPYTGKFISENHMRYSGSKRIRPEAKAWMNMVTTMVRVEKNRLGIVLSPPIHIALTPRWKNRRQAVDADNLHKATGDSIKVALQIDDQYFLWHDQEAVLAAEDAEIVIEIWGGDDDRGTDNNRGN